MLRICRQPFPPNQQQLAAELIRALYEHLCDGLPVGLAFAGWYDSIGSLLQAHEKAISASNTIVGPAAVRQMDLGLYNRVSAYDRASTVILGDPTVLIPKPA